MDDVTVLSRITDHLVPSTEDRVYLRGKLAKLSTDEYDAAGTAEMLVQTLVDTLGITRSRLANALVHFVYDGVYATKAERVSGGGCLELKLKVAEILGLEAGHITGD